MRLTCPNCGAQYEVDAAVIPDEGREVQCSNCGHTWFQLAAAAAPADDEKVAPPPAPLSDEPPSPPAPPDAPRRELDAALVSILKEEAEREQRARREEAADETFQDQPELGLDAPAGPRPAVKDRVARLRGMPGDADHVAGPETAQKGTAAGSRRDVLPDIEEISSTLSASSDRGADSIVTADEEVAVQRSGFRRGFAGVVLAAAAALAIYLAAPMIGGLHPALEPLMTAYVDTIDGWRSWINMAVPEALESATRALNREGT